MSKHSKAGHNYSNKDKVNVTDVRWSGRLTFHPCKQEKKIIQVKKKIISIWHCEVFMRFWLERV